MLIKLKPKDKEVLEYIRSIVDDETIDANIRAGVRQFLEDATRDN